MRFETLMVRSAAVPRVSNHEAANGNMPQSRDRQRDPCFAQTLPIAEAAPAERAGMPAGRAIIHRTASAIGTAVPAGPAAAGDADGIACYGLVERGQRHRLRRGDRRKAEANGKR